MVSPKANCEYCGLEVKKKALTLVHGVQCCWRCKRKGSFYTKKVYAPIIGVDRKSRGIHGIDFSHITDEAIQRLVSSMRRPLKKVERQLLWRSYKNRGMTDEEATNRLEQTLSGIKRTSAIKRLKTISTRNEGVDFKTEFEKLTARGSK